jgi:hypothetical protein
MAKNLDSAQVEELRAKQLESCPAELKISLIITGFQEDAAAKATFFTVEGQLDKDDGTKTTSEGRYRYSQLLEFNEKYGAIRLLRLFPPKKFIGNKEGDFVTQRRDALQLWLNELVSDEETCADRRIREFFKLTE